MNIPIYIEKAIKKAGETTEINRDNSEIVRNWLENKGLISEESENLMNEGVMDFLIDSIESGRDGSQGFIEYLRKL